MGPGLGVLAFNFLALRPLFVIFRRVGKSPWFALLVFVPVVGLLMIVAILAICRWPLLPRQPNPVSKKRRVAA